MSLIPGTQRKYVWSSGGLWWTQSLWMVWYYPGAFPLKVGAEATIHSMWPPPLLVRASPEMSLPSRVWHIAQESQVLQFQGFSLFAAFKYSWLPWDEWAGVRPPQWPWISTSCAPLGPVVVPSWNVGSRGSSTCSLLSHCPASSAVWCWKASQHEELLHEKLGGGNRRVRLVQALFPVHSIRY